MSVFVLCINVKTTVISSEPTNISLIVVATKYSMFTSRDLNRKQFGPKPALYIYSAHSEMHVSCNVFCNYSVDVSVHTAYIPIRGIFEGLRLKGAEYMDVLYLHVYLFLNVSFWGI